jgi:hypothetical protein
MGHPQYERTAEGGMGHASESGWDPPYLPRALLHAKVGHEDSFKTKLDKEGRKVTLSSEDEAEFDKELGDLLRHIDERLNMGVLEAWYSEEAYGDISEEFKKVYEGKEELAEKHKKANGMAGDYIAFAFEPEEQWARAFAEMTAFLPYSGVGGDYMDGATGENQRKVFERFTAAGTGVHPIIVACQDLCTICVLSRGFTLDPDLMTRRMEAVDDPANPPKKKLVEKVYNGTSCTAECVTYPAFDLGVKIRNGAGSVAKQLDVPAASTESPPTNGGTSPEKDAKTPTPKEPPIPGDFSKVSTLATLKDNGQQVPLRPGSILVFNGGGADYNSQDKGQAHIISVLRVSGQRVQFLETGALDAPHKFSDDSTVPPIPFSPFVGLGVLKPPKVPLGTCALNLHLSRPLGYVRLVVLDTTTDPPTPRFVSKLCHMRYNISGYIWALRGLPITGLRVVAYFSIPRRSYWSQPLIDNEGYAKTPAELIEDGKAAVKAAKAANPNADAWGMLDHMAAVCGHEDGSALVVRRRKANRGVIYVTKYVEKDDGTKEEVKEQLPRQQDTWYENFHTPAPEEQKAATALVGFTIPLGSTGQTLGGWAAGQNNANLRFVQRPGAPTAKPDSGDTGVAHFDGLGPLPPR